METDQDHASTDQQQPPDPSQTTTRPPTTSNDRDNTCNSAVSPPNKRVLKRNVYEHIFRNFLRRFIRGFTGGVLLHNGVRIVGALLRNPFRKKFPKLGANFLSKDCVRLAAFCALYPSIYHLIVDVIGEFHKKKTGWTYGIAGGVAGLSVAVLDQSRRETLTFFTLSRALGAGLSTLVSRGHVTSVPYGEVAVFCACTSVILYCTALKPEYMNNGYYKSLLKWSRDYTDQNLQNVYRHPGSDFLTCQEAGIHKDPCVQHSIVDFLLSLPGFAKVYLPIHVIPVLAFRRKVLRERPAYVLMSLAKNCLLSTLFLAVMVYLAKFGICVLRNLLHRPPPLTAFIPLVSGAICGLAILLERKSRRQELCLFVIPQVLTMFYNIAKNSRLGPYLWLPHGFTILFALSMMPLMHAYEREPESLTLLMNNALKFFIGPKTRTHCQTL